MLPYLFEQMVLLLWELLLQSLHRCCGCRAGGGFDGMKGIDKVAQWHRDLKKKTWSMNYYYP